MPITTRSMCYISMPVEYILGIDSRKEERRSHAEKYDYGGKRKGGATDKNMKEN